MRTSFLHIADVHLGTEQYHNLTRYNDFWRAFSWAGHEAIKRGARVLVVAGDLFNKSAIDPRALVQAYDVLHSLREAGVSVVAIEGNHDRCYYRTQLSWVQFLAEQDLVYALDVRRNQGDQGFTIDAWDVKQRRGAYVDIDGVRYLGFRYVGAATPIVIERVATQLEALPWDGVEYCVCLVHIGLDEFAAEQSGGLPRAAFLPLRKRVDYVALGHIHQPYQVSDWIHNPGSLETWRSDEARPEFDLRGAYHVAVDSDAPERQRATLLRARRRPFYLINTPITACESPDQILAAVRDHVDITRRRAAASQQDDLPELLREPVVEVFLRGDVKIDRSAIPSDAIQQELRETFHTSMAWVRDKSSERGLAMGETDLDGRTDHAAMERNVFARLLARDARYGERADEWAALTREIKEMALQPGRDPQEEVDVLRERSAAIARMAEEVELAC